MFLVDSCFVLFCDRNGTVVFFQVDAGRAKMAECVAVIRVGMSVDCRENILSSSHFHRWLLATGPLLVLSGCLCRQSRHVMKLVRKTEQFTVKISITGFPCAC